jgi:surfactin synthase thioesterase subunit
VTVHPLKQGEEKVNHMSAVAPGQQNAWIRRFHPAPEAPARLVCLPHAGGSANYYFPLSAALARSVDVLAVQYPGRGDRLRESGVDNMDTLADRVADALGPWRGRPLALFGHSMGATLAFEVARRLERDGEPLLALFASGRRAPSRHRHGSVHRYTDDELMAELKRLNGTDSRLLEDSAVLRLFLPAIRSDYKAIETYVCQPGAVITCPIHAFFGDSDTQATLEEVRAWRSHTESDFDLTVLPGGHFYLSEQLPAVTELVSKRLAGRARTGGGSRCR